MNKQYVYLCYDKKDLSIAITILTALEERGISVFTPSTSTDDGLWAEETQARIEGASIFMPIITESFVESSRCRKEVHFADALSKKMVTLFMQKTPLKYGLALLLTAEQAVEGYHFESTNDFINTLLTSKPIEELLNSTNESVTQSAFSEYLLYFINQKTCSPEALAERFNISLDKAHKVVSYMLDCGFISSPDENGVSKTQITQYGLELLYFKNKLGVSLKQLDAENKYIFISYAHKNSEAVLPILHSLQEEKIKLWFDEGIEVGSEWPATLQQKISECGLFMPFISNEFVESKNCKKEVFLANSLNLPMLPIYLEECKLKDELALQLAQADCIRRRDFEENIFFKNSISNHPEVTKHTAEGDFYARYETFILAMQLMLEKGSLSTFTLQFNLKTAFNHSLNLLNAIINGGFAKRNEDSKRVIPLITQKGLDCFYKKEKQDILF